MKYMRFIAMKYYELIIKLMIKMETVNYFYICSAKQKITIRNFIYFIKIKILKIVIKFRIVTFY